MHHFQQIWKLTVKKSVLDKGLQIAALEALSIFTYIKYPKAAALSKLTIFEIFKFLQTSSHLHLETMR